MIMIQCTKLSSLCVLCEAHLLLVLLHLKLLLGEAEDTLEAALGDVALQVQPGVLVLGVEAAILGSGWGGERDLQLRWNWVLDLRRVVNTLSRSLILRKVIENFLES